jgi:hypothetical protein
MKFNNKTMLKLINEHRELHDKLKKLKSEFGLEKNAAVRALYHSEVAEEGPYMKDYQDLENLKK